MARDPRDLKRLADELAALTPTERASVIADVGSRGRTRPLPKDFRPPLLRDSGGPWIGGDQRRDNIYDNEGR